MTTTTTAPKSFLGNKDQGVAMSEVCGVIGGVLGGVMTVAEGGSIGAGIGGAIVGAIGGYGMGSFLSPVSNHCGTSGKILTSAISASFGISVGQLAGMVGNSIAKVSNL